MKKKNLKLSLNRETLRFLDKLELEAAAGGVTEPNTTSGTGITAYLSCKTCQTCATNCTDCL